MSSSGATQRRGRTSARELLGDQDGLSIVEVLIAIVLLLVGVLGALVMMNTAKGTTLANQTRTAGTNLAREVADGSRAVQESVPYSQLSDGCSAPSSPSNPCDASSPIVAALQAQPGLAPSASSPAGEWVVEREGFEYSIDVAVCSMDDPGDGAGSHSDGGPFCSDAGAGGTADTAPDDYKRVVVDVNWAGSRGSENSRAVALLQSDGANGPAVTCLRPTASPCPATSATVVSSASTTSLQFTATISGSATRLVWYVDGAFQGTVTPTNGSATFTWSLGTVGSGSEVFDGSYEISASAFNSNGKSGTLGSVQVQINRRAPAAPGSFLAGRDKAIGGNGTIGGVDLDWLPVPDKDVLYYRVYRRVGTGSAVLLAQTSDTGVTAYTDPTPPANPTTWTAPCSSPRAAAASMLRYYVVAVDQNGASPREGTQTSTIDVNACNTAPKNPPANALTLTDNNDGTLTLNGALPSSPTDPDAGDRVNAVRIYRWTGSGSPAAPGDRLDYVPVGASATSFTFPDLSPSPDGIPQKYCFTTVDLMMQESLCSNVVTG